MPRGVSDSDGDVGNGDMTGLGVCFLSIGMWHDVDCGVFLPERLSCGKGCFMRRRGGWRSRHVIASRGSATNNPPTFSL